MPVVTDELLQQMVDVIVREADPEQIWLFGSQARGDTTERSDVDLLIVEREPFGPERDRRAEITRLSRLLVGFRVPKDILVFETSDFEWRRTGRNNVVARAVREGGCYMTDREEAAELLQIVARELRGLKGMTDAEVFADELFGFVAQQAVEKSLKAWLCVCGEVYPLTHNLSALFCQLTDCGQAVTEWEELAALAPYAVELRYEGVVEEPLPFDRADAIARVEALFTHVQSMIEPESDA